MVESFTLNVNGKSQEVQAKKETPLLYVLRNNLGLTGPKFGCGLGQCGACMVLVDGHATYSCQTRSGRVSSASITTLEGMSASRDQIWEVVEDAFWQVQAAQCGYCTNGVIIATISLLNRVSNPSDEEIKSALQGNLCRCGTYHRVIEAVKIAAKKLAQ